MYLAKTPKFIQKLFPHFIWKIPTYEKVVYLSFDDGPIPELTPWVLDLLDQYNAKASFFCVGENVKKYPGLYDRIIEEGHSIGNHTENHLNGWKTDNTPYMHNIKSCSKRMETNLFRPPYGKLKPKQVNAISKDYNIIMWDVLSGDFDPNISQEDCYDNVMNNIGPGSIVVFHDNLKAEENLKFVLPKVLEELSQAGYSFKNLESVNQHVMRREAQYA